MTHPPPLAEFLRSRREGLTPAEVGLKDNGRRRTPGLRREELATLAGVSIDYLVRLEQGRDTNPSTEIVGALATALQLDGDETRYMLGLASLGASPHLEQFCPAAPVLDLTVTASVKRLVDQLEPLPAFVSGPLGDVVTANQAWTTLMGFHGVEQPHNLIRHHFLHPGARTVFPDWAAIADDTVAGLRIAHGRLEAEPVLVALLDELMEAPEFAERWAAHRVSRPRSSALRLQLPRLDEIRLIVEVMDLNGHDQQLVTWIPADAASEAVLERVLGAERAASPAHLRVVGDM
ncbi:MAG: helix-turn-helix transcriptional regulator [Ilumatobacter sp.]|uniref:helix-turn-helix transcriptional regulator n=1 Tax=Ilumatobacter sp. TaxID=1967498 RepID=UPI003299E189